MVLEPGLALLAQGREVGSLWGLLILLVLLDVANEASLYQQLGDGQWQTQSAEGFLFHQP